MDYQKLRTELLTDPLARGYSGMSDSAAAADLNSTATGRTRNRIRVPVQEIFNSIVNVDWPAAGSQSESKLRALLQMAAIDASNSNTRGIIQSIFAAGTQTRTNLLALATEAISRADELGLGFVTTLDVSIARGGIW